MNMSVFDNVPFDAVYEAEAPPRRGDGRRGTSTVDGAAWRHGTTAAAAGVAAWRRGTSVRRGASPRHATSERP